MLVCVMVDRKAGPRNTDTGLGDVDSDLCINCETEPAKWRCVQVWDLFFASQYGMYIRDVHTG